MKPTALAACLVPIAFLLAGFASVPSPLSKQIEQADLVVIGRALENTTCPTEQSRADCVLMGDLVYLSNKEGVPAASSLHTFLAIGISEDRASCCRVGH